MAGRLKFLTCRRTTKKRTNLGERLHFDPLCVDNMTVILLSNSDKETREFVMKSYVSDMMAGSLDPLSAIVLAESVIPIASLPEAMGGDESDEQVEDAQYRVIIEDMGLDYNVPVVVILQAIKDMKKVEKQAAQEAQSKSKIVIEDVATDKEA
ncbi:hypothetical protein AMTRI_Chr11g94950 [Amborella trichopoda]